MIHLKPPEEIEYIRKSSLLVSQTHALLVEYIKLKLILQTIKKNNVINSCL